MLEPEKVIVWFCILSVIESGLVLTLAAYSDANRPLIPIQFGRHSEGFRPPFRGNSATFTSVFGHPLRRGSMCVKTTDSFAHCEASVEYSAEVCRPGEGLSSRIVFSFQLDEREALWLDPDYPCVKSKRYFV